MVQKTVFIRLTLILHKMSRKAFNLPVCFCQVDCGKKREVEFEVVQYKQKLVIRVRLSNPNKQIEVAMETLVMVSMVRND